MCPVNPPTQPVIRRANGPRRVRPGTARERKAQCAYLTYLAYLHLHDLLDLLDLLNLLNLLNLLDLLNLLSLLSLLNLRVENKEYRVKSK